MDTTKVTLPHRDNLTYLTDGGLETWLIFDVGMELPEFASFPLLDRPDGAELLQGYYANFYQIAVESGCGFVLESPTWRASTDWGVKLGYFAAELDDINRRAIELLRNLRRQWQQPGSPIIVSGNIGPRGDGYVLTDRMTAEQAQTYHAPQVESLAAAGADMICALTLGYSDEAIGVARAAEACGLPVAIGLTTETDGTLPSGQVLQAAIEEIDAMTGEIPAYYMLNCCHPDHFTPALDSDGAWTGRIGGVRANASRMSHEELDNAEELDAGDPQELGQLYQTLRRRFPQVNVLGGCCGTDQRHVAAIAGACC